MGISLIHSTDLSAAQDALSFNFTQPRIDFDNKCHAGRNTTDRKAVD